MDKGADFFKAPDPQHCLWRKEENEREMDRGRPKGMKWQRKGEKQRKRQRIREKEIISIPCKITHIKLLICKFDDR